ncbi:hypothetical protein BDV32DRAFT_121045 [Aspergillus pseudonomiae]|nr:hypothetical protein BDV32DRAFT_121045 [Aspergillus pseudonomiae]
MEALTLALAMGLIASCNAAPHDPIISLAVRENDQSEWSHLTVPNNQICTNFQPSMSEIYLDPQILPDGYPFMCILFRDYGCRHEIKWVSSEHPQETFKPALSIRCPQNPLRENGVPQGGDQG